MTTATDSGLTNSADTGQVVLDLRDVKKTFVVGTSEVGLWRASFQVKRGEFVAITGPSGSGKSTLLNLIGLLDSPVSGSLEVLGRSTVDLSGRQMADVRSAHISYIFQSFHLSPKRSVLQNVTDGLIFSIPRDRRIPRARDALVQVGLGDREEQVVDTLSGGERQRVAVARALSKRPSLLLADEPTGNLDSENTRAIFGLLKDIATDGAAVVIVTHDPDLATQCDRTLRVRDGHVVSDK